MSGLDIVILLKLFFNAYRGLNHGLIKTIIQLVGWFLALVLGIALHRQVAPLMQSVSDETAIQKVVAFALIVFVVMCISWLANYLLSGILKTIRLNWLNRLAGAIFGIAKTVIMVMILIYIFSPWLSDMSFWKNSMVIQFLAPHSTETVEYSKKALKNSATVLEKQPLSQNYQHVILPKQQTQQGHESSSEEKASSKVANPFQ